MGEIPENIQINEGAPDEQDGDDDLNMVLADDDGEDEEGKNDDIDIDDL